MVSLLKNCEYQTSTQGGHQCSSGFCFVCIRLAASKTKGTINSIELALLSRLAELMSRHGAEDSPQLTLVGAGIKRNQ